MKSPLKDRPLRNPGDSVQSALDDFILDKLVFYILLAAVSIVAALIDWYRYLANTPINPWHFTTWALIFLVLAIYKTYRAIPEIRNLKLGRDGERVVGQYLETLRETGAKVFHDIPGDKFNLDHVVISGAGIFLIETKTYSKPLKGEPTITFDGKKVTLRERGTFEAPVNQVKAGAHWLGELLKNSTGKMFPIRPVLVFPGWYVQPTVEARSSEVWVLNPKALPTFIANSNLQLSAEDVSLIAYHLSRYVRTYKA
jgi:hypothetical protein